MRLEIDAVLAKTGGVASREYFLRQGVRATALDREIRDAALVRLAPRVYCRPWDVDDIELRERAALIRVRMPAALSHLTALRRLRLTTSAPAAIHMTVPATRCLRPGPGIVVHRAQQLPPTAPVDGLTTVAAAHALAASWPLLRGTERREPAIRAVRQRLVTPAELLAAVQAMPRLAGRRELMALIELLAAGCESELEIWGYLRVFDVPGLNHAVRQKVVYVAGRVYRLDLAYDDERVAVELDGERYHSSREQRESDRRRDAALARIGWLTLRFSHHRLHEDVAGCRRDTLATLAARRARMMS